MSKSLLLLSFCLLILRGVTTAQNPYESLGKTTEVLTLSNGKYQEFMTNDTLVQIGSVLFNTVTNEVVSFLNEDTLRLMDADLTTRFLSVDPIGRDYPELTPYQFASNTPINSIDLDGLEAEQAIGGKIGITATIGATNANLTVGLNIAYARTTSSLSSEFTLGITASSFTKINGHKTNGGISVTTTGSAMFGSGQNTDLAGSGIVNPLGVFNSAGGGGFNGGGIGFTAIKIRGNRNSEVLSNLSLNGIGRFQFAKGSFSINIMEDFLPFGFDTDHGSTGTFAFNYTQEAGKNQAFNIGYSNETYTSKAVKGSARMASADMPSLNRQAGYEYWSKYENKAPAYGVNSLNLGLSSNYMTGSVKLGLYGGRQGAAVQNSIHKHLVSTPLFNHDTSYFGKLFWEINASGGSGRSNSLGR